MSSLEEINKNIVTITREKIYQQLQRFLMHSDFSDIGGKLSARKTIQEGISFTGAIYPGKISFTWSPMETQSKEKAHLVTAEILIRGDGHDFDNSKLYDFLEKVVGYVNTWFTEHWKCGDWFAISQVVSGDPLVSLTVKDKTVPGARVVIEGHVIRTYDYETS